jgi:hypothetical protein
MQHAIEASTIASGKLHSPLPLARALLWPTSGLLDRRWLNRALTCDS